MTPNAIPARLREHAATLLEGGFPKYEGACALYIAGSLVGGDQWVWADRAHQAVHLCLVADLVEQGDLYVDWRGICVAR